MAIESMDISKLQTPPTQPIPPIRPVKPVAPADRTQFAPRMPIPAVAPGLAQNPGSFGKDVVHITATKSDGRPAAMISFSEPEHQFGSAVHVDTPADPNRERLFGMLNLTNNQKQQIRAAEARAFDRFFHAGNSPERGSIQAKLRQSAISTYQPGYLEHNIAGNITDQEKDQIMDALKEYGEDLAAIGIMGRNRRELQRYVEDKFFITIFDRDREEFEDYFKGGVKDFFGDNFGNNTPDNHVIPPKQTSSDGLVDLPNQQPTESYKWRFFQPRLGVSLKGLDFKEAELKPKVDLVRLRGPAETEVRLIADVPFNFNGKYEPRGEIYARRIINYKPGDYGGWKDNVFAESRAEYDFTAQQMRTSLGVRKQISPDSSMGLYALYSKTFAGDAPEDLGLGVNYQSRFN